MNPIPNQSDALPAPPYVTPPDVAEWFKAEVQPHDAAFRRYLRHQVPSPSDVDDVVQDSYLKVLKARSLGHISSARAYLFTAGRNTALKLLRKRRVVSPVPVSELPEWRILDGDQDVARSADRQLQNALIAEAVDTLPERCREIFLLRTSDGLSFPEIALRLGVAEGTVRTQVGRALSRCAEYLEQRTTRER